jgi:Big-like domain-containing protein/beta-propeller repeat-containing protein
VERTTVTARLLLATFAIACAAVGIAAHATPHDRIEAGDAAATLRVAPNYGRLPMLFEQVPASDDAAARFVGHGGPYSVAIDGAAIRFALRRPPKAHAASPYASVLLEFAEPQVAARLEGIDAQPAMMHRISHAAGDARIGATYARVRLADVYPGIDVIFYGRGGELEHDIVVAPGADLSRVGLRAAAGAELSLDGEGNLLVSADEVSLTFHPPIAYQEAAGVRQPVESGFVIDPNRIVRFRVGVHDPARTLVIDPVASYATYLGGKASEQGTAIAVDAAGNAYVAGYTASTDFPIVNGYDRSLGKSGDVDVFVSKLNAAGTALVWSTFIGGAGSVDRAVGLAVGADGSAYVTGLTASNNFPVSATAWQKAIATGGAFVAKLGPGGNTLAYSTYVAGATPSAIAVDGSGNAYVSGTATPAFVTTSGALRTSVGSGKTGFVLKLKPDGSAPAYATFLGGSAGDAANSIAIDARGNAFVGGSTTSADFPTVNAFQPVLRGQADGFVAKLDAAGQRLLYSTFLGGSLDDSVNAIAIDREGNAYAAGETYAADFPSRGGFQPHKSGSHLINSSLGNAFVAKLAPGGNALVYSSFIGGEICTGFCQPLGSVPQYPGDVAYAIAVDGSGHAYVGGLARTYTFPLVDSSSPRKQQDNQDSAFVAKFSAAGSDLLWSTFLRTGYSESDDHWTRFPTGAVTGIAVDGAGAAYVTGDANSSSSFPATAGSLQPINTDGPNAIVVKFAAVPDMALTSSDTHVDVPASFTLTATLSGSPLAGSVLFIDGASSIGSASLSGNTATLTTSLPPGIHSLTALLRLPGVAVDTPVLRQVVDVPLSCN